MSETPKGTGTIPMVYDGPVVIGDDVWDQLRPADGYEDAGYEDAYRALTSAGERRFTVVYVRGRTSLRPLVNRDE